MPFVRSAACVLTACACLAFAGCGGSGQESPTANAAATVSSAGPGRAVRGRAPITTSGTPAIVVLEPAGTGQQPTPAAVPVMDQSARTFLPPVLFARTGHPAEFRNSDEEMHNINVKHGVTRAQAFNVSVATGDAYRHTFETPGLYDVACDVHAGMSAQIVVTRGPHVTVADAEGQFGFSSVTPGRYTLIVYAGAEPIERPVDVATADISLDVSGG